MQVLVVHTFYLSTVHLLIAEANMSFPSKFYSKNPCLADNLNDALVGKEGLVDFHFLFLLK